MIVEVFVGLINNVALLMALIVVSEFTNSINIKNEKKIPYLNGILIGLIGLAIMMEPFTLSDGIIFDTRSILLSVTALTFGPVPSVIAAAFLLVYRLILGGEGVAMGAAVIIASFLIGILWRKHLLDKLAKHRWLNIYLFGITVHLAMLACVFLIPWPSSMQVFQQIGLPVIVIYPAVTVVLSLLLFRQKERKESIKRIAEAEGKYKSIFDNNYACMLLIDPVDGHIVDANSAALQFYGWSPEQLKSMKITQINTLSDKEIRSNIENTICRKKNHYIFQHRIASGGVVDVEVYSGPIIINGKQMIYSIIHDISERAAALGALKASEERFRLLIENAPEAIFIQIYGRFAFLNQFTVNLLGAKSEEELLGTPVMERFHPDYWEVIEKRVKQLNDEKEAVPSNEEVFVKMDGTLVDVDVTAVPLHYQDCDGALVFARDITDRKRLEHAKSEVEAQLRQQQKLEAIGTLAGGVAHEINNPINGIMNYAQLIQDISESDEAISNYTGEIIRETERVATIVKNLLQFSRQEKQSHSYACIYDIINQTISLIKTVVKRDQISLVVDLDDYLPDIKCRSQQIQQVLMNLMTNARDALNEKYPDYNEDKIIRLTCSQYEADGRRWVKIIVEDHGNGIPVQIRDKIFEPFFSTKPKEIGTGLGLSISFGIVKDHHGKITIDSKEGFYTKFILDLPVDNGWDLKEIK
jgi:PAS domain S-box-containing protein